jgi:hypothetical protein
MMSGYMKLHEGRYGKVSFVVIFIIVWIVIFALAHLGGSTLPYGEFALQTAIFSTLIAFLVALCCVLSGGGTRDPKELTDGHTIVGI